MKNFIKHLFMLCLFGMISIGANAEEIPNNEIWYTSSDGKVVTPHSSNVFGADIVSNTYTNDKGIIKFDGDVTSIGREAFRQCYQLTSVSIPNSVTSIKLGAFRSCSSLTSVKIPNSVTSIDWAVFVYCSGLTSIVVESGNTVYDSRDNCNAIIETASNTLISGCKNTTIPNSVTSIMNFAFDGCSGLTSVIIPNSVISIGGDAFRNCSSLTSVTIPNSVTSIGEYAFLICTSLTSVNISDLDKWVKIEFYDRTANPLYNAHNLYLNGQLVTNATLTTAKKINTAFSGCSSLKSVTIGKSVTSIGSEAFYECSGLKSVTIGKSVTSIGSEAFYECSGLENIIADGINAPTTTGSSCFYNVKNCTLHVPLNSEESYASKFGNFKSGSGNKIETYSAYSKSSAGEYSFETWDATSNVTLSEGIEKVYVPVEATVNSLKYKRTFNNTDWQALYVPFELDVKTDLADFSVYEISTSSADAINVTLMTEGKTSANTPYLIKAKTTGEKAISVSSKKVKVTMENTNSELSDFEIVGTYAKLKYGDIAGDWYALKGGKFMKAGEGAYLNPYRFYLKRKALSAKESIEININEPTGIEALQNADKSVSNGKRYNMQGIEVNENYNGMIIINGKKYLKK